MMTTLKVAGTRWALTGVGVGGVTGSKSAPGRVPAKDPAWTTGACWRKPRAGQLLSGPENGYLCTGIWRLSRCEPAPDGLN